MCFSEVSSIYLCRLSFASYTERRSQEFKNASKSLHRQPGQAEPRKARSRGFKAIKGGQSVLCICRGTIISIMHSALYWVMGDGDTPNKRCPVCRFNLACKQLLEEAIARSQQIGLQEVSLFTCIRIEKELCSSLFCIFSVYFSNNLFASFDPVCKGQVSSCLCKDNIIPVVGFEKFYPKSRKGGKPEPLKKGSYLNTRREFQLRIIL